MDRFVSITTNSMKCVVNWIPLRIRVRSRNTQRHLQMGLGIWGWVFLERTQTLSGIQFTTHFIECFVVETKRFVGSSGNVILTRQTCGQRSSRAAESKRRALEIYFSERICYVFPMSKCRGDRYLGLCTFFVLARSEPLRNGNFRKKTCFARRKNQYLALRSGFLFAKTQKVHQPRSRSPLHFDIRIYGKFARKNKFLALGL